MPFDGQNFPERHRRREPAHPSDNVVTTLIILICAVLLVMPISLAALADIVRYLRGR